MNDDALVGNAGDAKQVARGQAKETRRKRRVDGAFAELAKTPHGKIVLGELLERANVFTSPFSTDPIQMAFNAGKQAFGLRLLHLVDELGPTTLVDVVAFYRKEMKNA